MKRALRLLHNTHRVPSATHHSIKHRTSHITHHVPGTTHQKSHITPDTSHIPHHVYQTTYTSHHTSRNTQHTTLTCKKRGLASANPDAMLIDKYIEGFRQCCWINKKNRIVITGRGSIKPAATNDSFKLSTPVIRRWKTIIPAIILQKYKIERLHIEHFLYVKLIYHLADQRVLFGSFRIVSAWITKENRQGVWIMVLWHVTHCPRPAVWIFFRPTKE